MTQTCDMGNRLYGVKAIHALQNLRPPVFTSVSFNRCVGDDLECASPKYITF